MYACTDSNCSQLLCQCSHILLRSQTSWNIYVAMNSGRFRKRHASCTCFCIYTNSSYYNAVWNNSCSNKTDCSNKNCL